MLDPLTTSDSIGLMLRAEMIIRQTWPHAILVEAQGTCSGGIASNSLDIDTWLFAAELLPPESVPQATVLLQYTPRGFGATHHVAQPWLGNVIETLPHTMSLDRATRLLRAAGFNGAFRNVTLRRPLTFPAQTEASYFFGMTDGQLVAVGTQTGRVGPVRLELKIAAPTSPRQMTGT
jgi:hypothetical protein